MFYFNRAKISIFWNIPKIFIEIFINNENN